MLRFAKPVILAGVMTALTGLGASAEEYRLPELRPFFGSYTGSVVLRADEGRVVRPVRFVVRPHGPGFALDWTISALRPDDTVKTDAFRIGFKAFRVRPGSFFSTDYLSDATQPRRRGGPPSMLAKIEDGALVIFTGLVNPDGSDEIQTYRLTPVPGGLHLRFKSERTGHPDQILEVELTADSPETG